MNPLILAIWAAAGVQVIIAVANVMVARTLDYRANVARLSAIVGEIFIVHAVYIVIIIVWFSLLCALFATRLASGDPLARFLCGSLAAFWGLRASIQLTIYDKEVRTQHRGEDIAFLAACIFLAGVFLTVALH
jgi:hypothetical protein